MKVHNTENDKVREGVMTETNHMGLVKVHSRDNDKVRDGGDGDIGGGFRLGNGRRIYGIGGGLNRLGVNRVDF